MKQYAGDDNFDFRRIYCLFCFCNPPIIFYLVDAFWINDKCYGGYLDTYSVGDVQLDDVDAEDDDVSGVDECVQKHENDVRGDDQIHDYDVDEVLMLMKGKIKIILVGMEHLSCTQLRQSDMFMSQ